MSSNPLLSAQEAAPLIGLKPRTLYALAAAGKIAKEKGGFSRAALEAYSRSCRREATPRPSPAPRPLPPITMAPFPRPQKPSASELRRERNELERQRKEDRRALVAFHTSKRRTAKLQRTPPWSDLEAMRAIYDEAQRLTRETGEPHHVDHIIPLQGKTVSGLHVPGNLQILTGAENSRKRNRFEVEV